MVAINFKFILLAISAAGTLAMPTEAEAEGLLDTLDRRLTCMVDRKKYSFSEDAAKDLVRQVRFGGDARTASGYPHIFNNMDGIKWDNRACMSRRVRTLEFPIFENGKVFEWRKKGQDPGRCRVVYSEHDGYFCGVMCHKSHDHKVKGFIECT